MKRRSILVAAGFLLVAFGLGVGVGTRFGRKPATTEINLQPPPSPRVPDALAGSSPLPCADVRNAAPLVGRYGCVAGLVLRVYSSRTENTFLDFCEDYRSCPFTSVIFAPDKNKFRNLESLQGKRVEIRGEVVSYQGHAEIIIHDPEQIRSTR